MGSHQVQKAIFNRKNGGSHVVELRASMEVSGIRSAEMRSETYTVVPVVALVEGVLHSSNSANPELALASEFGLFVDGWNGRPVVVGHPVSENGPVSANSADLWGSTVVGYVFNSRMDETGKKLCAEMFINNEWAKNAGQEEIVKALADNKMLEVSTGLYAVVEQTKGLHGNDQYHGIWRNIVPDHLAILPPGVIGACSVADGCGAPRMNTQPVVVPAGQETVVEKTAPNGDVIKTHCACDGKVTKVEVIPNEEAKGIFGKLMDTFKASLGYGDQTDRTVRSALQEALKAAGKEHSYVEAVKENTFVYYCYDYSSGIDGSFERNYSISSDGTVTLGASMTAVRAEVNYVPVKVVDQSAPPQVSQGQPTEVPVTTAANTAGAPAANAQPVNSGQALLQQVEQTPQPVQNAAPTPPTLDQFLANASPEVRATFEAGKAAQLKAQEDATRARGELTTKIRASGRAEFSDAELQAMSVEMLTKLAQLADVNFRGQSNAAVPERLVAADTAKVPDPEPMFPKVNRSKEKAGA